MEADKLIEKLMCFGLTRQEAAIYLCLVQNGKLTGYEAAKKTGISRSNAYNALAGLADKGAAYTEEGKAVKYCAVEVLEFCSNKIRALEEMKCRLKESMPEQREYAEGYLTIAGDTHIQDKIKNMIESARHRIYLSMEKSRILMFEKEIHAASAAGKKVVILTDGFLKLEGTVSYQTEERKYQIGVISDSAYVLTGEFGHGEESTCLYCGQPNFVQVFKDSMRNEIKLIQLTKGET